MNNNKILHNLYIISIFHYLFLLYIHFIFKLFPVMLKSYFKRHTYIYSLFLFKYIFFAFVYYAQKRPVIELYFLLIKNDIYKIFGYFLFIKNS